MLITADTGTVAFHQMHIFKGTPPVVDEAALSAFKWSTDSIGSAPSSRVHITRTNFGRLVSVRRT